MAPKTTQYVVVPAAGLIASEDNPQQMQFFQVLHQAFSSPRQIHSLSTHTGMLPVKVVDSIGENKAKLIECAPDDLPALRAAHPSVRILPVVYYQPAVMRYEISMPPGLEASRATTRRASTSKGITVTVVSSEDKKPVAEAMVVAFTNFASRTGAQGTTNSSGKVTLSLGAGSKKIQRLYVYPKLGFWSALQKGVTLKTGSQILLQPIDLKFVDCVRSFYGGGFNQIGGVSHGRSRDMTGRIPRELLY